MEKLDKFVGKEMKMNNSDGSARLRVKYLLKTSQLIFRGKGLARLLNGNHELAIYHIISDI